MSVDHLGDAAWGVTVNLNGLEVVAIGSNHLSGREIGLDEETVIRIAVSHLLAFIGDTDVRDATLNEVCHGIWRMHPPNQTCADFANAIITNVRNLRKQ